jgi:hypothetical protein
MVGIVALWRCKCGVRVKVVAEAESNRPPSTQVAISPKCGDTRFIEAEKITSITEVIEIAYSAKA